MPQKLQNDGSDMSGRTGVNALLWLWVLMPVVASWSYGAWLFTRLPASVPVHWGLNGQVDRYGGPLEAALLLPIMVTFIGMLLAVVSALGIPGNEEYAQTRGAMLRLTGYVLLFMFYLQLVTSWMFMGRSVHLLSWLALGAGLLFIAMGNLLPKLKRNGVAGVRLPWTMRSDLAWLRSQRMAGLAFVILGALLVLLSPLPGMLPLFAVLLGKLVVVSLILWYSWKVSRMPVAAESE